jgi:hypothetical protein
MTKEMTAQILGKFCNLGVVTSINWSKLFLVIENRTFKVYVSEHDYKHRPEEVMFEVPLDHDFRASPWKRKEYEEVAGHKTDLYCFYIEQDGLLGENKLFKIGTPDMELAEKVMRCVETNTRNRTKSF